MTAQTCIKEKEKVWLIPSIDRSSLFILSLTTMTVFATLGLFIIDEFSYFDDEGLPTTNILAPQGSLASESTGSTYLTPSPLDRRWRDLRSYRRSNMVRNDSLYF